MPVSKFALQVCVLIEHHQGSLSFSDAPWNLICSFSALHFTYMVGQHVLLYGHYALAPAQLFDNSCKSFSYSLYKIFLMYFGQERPMLLAHPFGMHQTIRLLCPTSHFSLAIDQDAIIVLIGELFVKFFFHPHSERLFMLGSLRLIA